MTQLLLALCLLAPAPSPEPAPTPTPTPRAVVDRVAAVVNGEVITLADLQERAGEDLRRAQAAEAGPARDAAVAAALKRAYEGVLAEKLFGTQAKELGVEITDSQVDAALDQKKNELRVDDRQFELLLQENGLTRAAYKAQVKRELEVYRVLEAKVRSRVKVADDDLRNYYQTHQHEFGGEEEVHVRHIFLPLPVGASAAEEQAARAAGERVLQRLATGEDFAAVAREVSKGPGAEDGGDLGWLRRGTIERSLEEAAFALKDGQVSGLVRAGPGLHLFRAEGHRRGGARTFEQVREELRERLYVEQTQTYRAQYLAELKRDALIEVLAPELRP